MAFGVLADRFSGRIFAMLYARTRRRMDAEDLTQEVFIRALEKLHRLREPDRFGPWLFSIAVNAHRDHWRRKKATEVFSLAWRKKSPVASPPEAEEKVVSRQFWDRVHVLAKRLSATEREIFFLRFVDDLSIREVAEILGKSESAVKTHLYRALNKFRGETSLRDWLKGDGES